MKDPLNRTKVVIRHLPPSISQSALMEQIDGRFSGRYRWFSFHPGKNSQKNLRYSLAYIDFQSPEDVVEFAEFFDGHIFVNEKGTQFKAVVEYAPSQHVPMVSSKKDGREGTIFKDPEYVEFLELIAKPIENLPSAEIQLERREAERSGGPKEAVIVTPLMDFIRQKRAAKSGSQRSSSRRAVGAASSSSSSSSKRGSERRRGSSSVFILRDSEKTSSTGKDKSKYILVSRKEEKPSVLARRAGVREDTGSNGTIPISFGGNEVGKKLVLLKGQEREASNVLGGLSQQLTASARNLTGSTSSKQSPRHEASGRIIRSVLSNKDARQSRSYLVGIQPEWQTQAVNSERDKRPPRPPNPSIILKDHITNTAAHQSDPDNDGKDDKAAVNNLHGSGSVGDKTEKRMINKDRPDRGVWTPRRSDGTQASDGISLPVQQLSDFLDGISLSQQAARHNDRDDDIRFQSARGGRGTNSVAAYDAPNHGEIKSDLPYSIRKAENRSVRSNISSAENGARRHIGRRGSARSMKEVDGPLDFSEGKPSKRGVSAGHGSYEKQVWVQKSGSGS